MAAASTDIAEEEGVNAAIARGVNEAAAAHRVEAPRHGFILCCIQSTKNTPTWYKTYAIVGVVSIPTYKKCYAPAIFEFPENNGASQKSSLPCLDLLSYLLSDFGIFSRQRKFHVTPVF